MSCRMNEHCTLLPTSEYEACALLSASPRGSRAQLLRLQPAWDDLCLLMLFSSHTGSAGVREWDPLPLSAHEQPPPEPLLCALL